jgi:phosphopantothenoylcysteine synthetase/decarboxylase
MGLMEILVTAGNAQVPIDQVRCLTNIFTGRTGAAIALAAYVQGHDVTFLTSHPDVVLELNPPRPLGPERWRPYRYRTFADLERLMGTELTRGGYDVVIHSAAVSDYLAGGIYAPAPGTYFNAATSRWHGDGPALEDRAAAKVKSDEPELWLRLTRAPKLVDMVRQQWSFRGILVKFKLEVGVSEERLLEIAEQSRRHSDADLMVANTLEGSHEWAYLGPTAGGYQRVNRRELPQRVLEAVVRSEEHRHG